MKKIASLAGVVLLAFAAPAWADEIDPSTYSLDSIIGSFAWGNHDYNAAGNAGFPGSGWVDNVADLGMVEAMMRDGYVMHVWPSTIATGIYNWSPAGLHALEFSFNGGINHVLDTFTFITTRSYSQLTPITVDYAVDGGPWQTAVATTSGQLGIVNSWNNPEQTFTLDLGGVIADQFRWTTDGGNQVSLHEISLTGSVAPAAVPEPGTLILLGLGTAGLGIAARRRRKKQGKAA